MRWREASSTDHRRSMKPRWYVGSMGMHARMWRPDVVANAAHSCSGPHELRLVGTSQHLTAVTRAS